jgi:hypothetical protein
LHVTEGLEEADLIALLDDDEETIRSWSIQLLAEGSNVSQEALGRFATMARDDGSQLVRLYLASALQRIPPADRWDVLAGLYQHAEDADDHNLPLMVWYAAEPMATVDMDRTLTMALDTDLPNLLAFTVRRIAAINTPEALRVLSQHLGEVDDESQQKELLKGLNEMISGTE